MTELDGKTFVVRSKTTTTKEKEEEVEKKYSAFLMDDEPDSKLRIGIHSDSQIAVNVGDNIKLVHKKNQTKIEEK